ncbi:MAG: N-acetylglucosamine-6-phosphate deacetylase [Firmicutes bacterium]|nr:N-acetylglucosamine-6-phosphate deacetylase [Bacillota bacterium]MDH7494435.1 N-acetylglucosamine-6-phosphate deacetylase [Bacillota bacterium]
MIIKNADILTPRGIMVSGFVVTCGGKIAKVGSHGEFREYPTSGHEVFDARGLTLVPGFVDIHVHGGGGHDVLEGTYEAVAAMCRAHAVHGTTSLLPTTMAARHEDLLDAVRAVADAARRGTGGAEVLGVHLEGPWINPESRGAQALEAIRPPSVAELDRLIGESGGLVRITTVAPELEGACEFIEEAVARGVRVSLGHSMASFEEVVCAMRSGATHITHAFNAMSGLHHRRPGMVGAMLACDELTAEAILDGFHLHPAAVAVLHKCKGVDKLALVTDATMAACMQEGEYELGGQRVSFADGAVRLPDGNLAGSALTLDRAVRRAMDDLGITLAQAVAMASQVPARVAGVYDRKGSIENGKDADMVLIDRSGMIGATFVRGVLVHQALA